MKPRITPTPGVHTKKTPLILKTEKGETLSIYHESPNREIYQFTNTEGKFHRENDLPATEVYQGGEPLIFLWYQNGNLYRSGAKPARIQFNTKSENTTPRENPSIENLYSGGTSFTRDEDVIGRYNIIIDSFGLDNFINNLALIEFYISLRGF
jgi:hypothetical protein